MRSQGSRAAGIRALLADTQEPASGRRLLWPSRVALRLLAGGGRKLEARLAAADPQSCGLVLILAFRDILVLSRVGDYG